MILLHIERSIVNKLADVEGVAKIFVEPDSDDLTSDSIDEPIITVSNSGYTVNHDSEPVGCNDNQKVTSLWTIAVTCKKEDYLTKAAIIQMAIIKSLVGFRPDEGRFKMRLVHDAKTFNVPSIGERVSYYPTTFGIDVIV